MIKVYNPTKLTRTAFFQELIQYLDQQDDVTLRQIKKEFATVLHVDRQLDRLIEAGYIRRKDRRYTNAFSCLTSLEGLRLDQEIFVETTSPIFEELSRATFTVATSNSTNKVIIEEEVDALRERLTLSSYFYKLSNQLPLSSDQEVLYQLLGDVNKDYAMKYMTTFLLKFARKDRVLQRRSDIFVRALEILGFIKEVDAQTYALTMGLDKENLVFYTRQKSNSNVVNLPC
ncbi:DUF1803 domain-containing protein [Streptococcus sp. zg-86]|uniref:DUF1803 domain-containing protein n=1 Tax=Streptococcus zhangguiae TaxID=2664091 RepID=A0A6I4RG63_9STRE|nr:MULTISPECIES: DUF1803 domain-containing protein [unclassified Streptococcus]MTB64893.1 DUF1803 domain-containing protein [Streptococcus sp. zg-86]MTB91037.1 DUF1803 domain-containing protein [Streptococcus sp. zg-36]MWV56880.1 DUF1803 domain-containing protein [Streptococcus sp. zg-70]QTH48711.1 DUF1803 domain-containing protein [Streptococcus sp. zg-86]